MSVTKVKIGVIGIGYLGRFHVEKLRQINNCELVALVESDIDTLNSLKKSFNNEIFKSYKQLKNKVDAVSIVTPTIYHHEIAKFFLENKIDVFVEKPMTSTVEQAKELDKLAKKKNCILQIGHLERFNPTIIELTNHIKQPKFIEVHRLTNFRERSTDINVILDLMIHDIDIMLKILNTDIKKISAIGTKVFTKTLDIVNARILFSNKCIANITASRVSFKDERKIRIFQPDSYISLDMHKKKILKYKKKTKGELKGYKDIEIFEKEFKNEDPLLNELDSFVNCVANKKKPIVSAIDGIRALKVADMINEALKEN